MALKVKPQRRLKNATNSEYKQTDKRLARVALEVPFAPWFDYEVSDPSLFDLQAFDWVMVTWGKGQRVGLFLEYIQSTEIEPQKLKPLLAKVAAAPNLSPAWQQLVHFASQYYQRSIGEIALPSLPKTFKVNTEQAFGKATAKWKKLLMARTVSTSAGSVVDTDAENQGGTLALTRDQAAALEQLKSTSDARKFVPTLLYGVTGSGKTEVYLRWFELLLKQNPQAQVLLLVPEIALTPRLVKLIVSRFPQYPAAVLHSELAEGERAAAWLAAACGEARIVIGTRLSLFVPLPGLAAIVVDEEHDPSFKQPDAAFYSARDLALSLGLFAKVPVLLGSATPSLETWQAAKQGRYQLLKLTDRATGAPMPQIRLVRPGSKPVAKTPGTKPMPLSLQSLEALEACLADKKQALVFLNRRGYAPVLFCTHCDWLSQCDACSAYRVLHKSKTGYRLICHHCSQEQRVPKQCPECGNTHLEPLGQGTQGLEEMLQRRFPEARLRRVDRDVAKKKGAVETIISEVHAGEADLLIGTQMLAKGHDFKQLGLVIVLDCDGALYSGDFRARERLFATLMQVAGRAGRATPGPDTPLGKVLIETRFEEDPLFQALLKHDYETFAAQELAERQQVGFPPFRFQALLRARSRSMDHAIAWLAQAKQSAMTIDLERGPLATPGAAPLVLHDPVPMPLARLAHQSRAQLLIESPSRKVLQIFLKAWLATLRGQANPGSSDLHWQLEIDPQEI